MQLSGYGSSAILSGTISLYLWGDPDQHAYPPNRESWQYRGNELPLPRTKAMTIVKYRFCASKYVVNSKGLTLIAAEIQGKIWRPKWPAQNVQSGQSGERQKNQNNNPLWYYYTGGD